MIAKKSLWKSFKSSPESKQDDGEEQMSQYNLCVEEIKNERKVLGSLELHEEAMRRLNQRRSKDCAPSHPPFEEGRRDKFIPDRIAPRPKYIPSISEGASSAPPRRGNALTRSITLMVTGKHGHTASDPSKEKMPGRRTSVLTSVEFDEGVTAAQVRQDLDLSDSESEAAGPPTPSPGQMAEGGGKSGGRRRSFLTGSSSRIIGRPLRTAVRRFSKRLSFDLSDSEDEGVDPTTHPPTHSPGRPVDSGGNSGGGSRSFMRRSSSNLGLPQWIAVSRYSKRRSSASIDGDDHVLSSKTHDDANEREENVEEIKSYKIDDGKPEPTASIDLVSLVLDSYSSLQTNIDADEHVANLEERESYKTDDMKPTINDQAEKSDTESMLSWRTRIGKRRSSLFSVNERRPTVDSMKGSFNGSLAGESRDGSLICNFRARNSLSGSYVEDDTLICDWGRRHSDSDVQSIQEGLLNGMDEKASSGSLICGWDRSELTILSHSSVTVDRSVQNST
jgi:hypothetical protein